MNVKQAPIDRLLKPVHRFIDLEYTGGLTLFSAVIVAIVWVNAGFADAYHHVWETPLSIGFGGKKLQLPLHHWINDGLMVIFFYVIGLELKREFMAGELSSPRKAILPLVAALGGMLVPAGIYALVNRGGPGAPGWGIPMATDIAFAIALISLVGKSVPPAVKVFLSALAVADDLGAVLVIALFYSGNIQYTPLFIGLGLVAVLIIGNYMGIRHSAFYLLIGIGVWIGFLLSGVHATIAGVLVAFTIPARTTIDEQAYSARLKQLSDDFDTEVPERGSLTTLRQHQIIEEVKALSLAAQTPLQKIEHTLHPWVAYVIMPLFALANAGITIGGDFIKGVSDPVSIGVILGLVIGKFTGVFSFTWVMIKSGLSAMPGDANWRHIAGVATLAGIGFTMSLFVSSLAFTDNANIEHAKYGILIASVIAGSAGYFILRKKPA
ncbi:MAG: Na+/H+ antiporter NhaA [Mucilaginibacter polytrichastri]|nr:Na+/H+ antiporter NhaA [Mucilaginibacter polytrichastri]